MGLALGTGSISFLPSLQNGRARVQRQYRRTGDQGVLRFSKSGIRQQHGSPLERPGRTDPADLRESLRGRRGLPSPS